MSTMHLYVKHHSLNSSNTKRLFRGLLFINARQSVNISMIVSD
jgi:hypothetical protein